MTEKPVVPATGNLPLSGLLLLFLPVLPVFGCQAPEPSNSSVTVWDSAGVTIIENGGFLLAEGEEWVLVADPVLEIGGLTAEPEYNLWRVNGALRLSDGRILVANGGTQELRYFDARGRHLASVGGEGEGPGEFRWVDTMLRLPGDSILVYDGQMDRLSLFNPDSEFVESWPTPGLDGRRFHIPRGVLQGGTLLVSGNQAYVTGGTSQVVQDSVLYLRMPRTGQWRDTLGWFPNGDRYVVSTPRSVGFVRPPFQKNGSLAVHAGEVFLGVGEPYQIQVRTGEGELIRLIRRSLPSRPLTDELLDRFRNPDPDEGGEERSEPYARAIQGFQYPSTIPFFSEILVDREGFLWVRLITWPEEGDPLWEVFDPSGRLITSVKIPEGFQVHDVGRDWVLGVWTDEFDVEYLRMYRLRRTDSP